METKKYNVPYKAKSKVLWQKVNKLNRIQRVRDLISPEQPYKVQEEVIVQMMYVYEQSFDSMKNLSVSNFLNSRLSFKGRDLLSEKRKLLNWYSLMLNDMFSNRQALFYSERGNGLLINPSSRTEVEDYLEKYRFAGKIIAFGIRKYLFIDSVHLGRVFLKIILQRKIELNDVECADEDFYKDWLLDVKNHPTAKKRFFTFEDKPLIKNGDQIPVTESNVNEYIRLVIEYKYVKSVQLQIDAFLDGFNSILPLELIKYFRPSELEIVLYSIKLNDGELVLGDLYNRTDIFSSKDPDTHKIVEWFWQVMNGFDQNDWETFLYFVTGTTRIQLSIGTFVSKLFVIYIDLDANEKSLARKNKNSFPTVDISARRLYLPFYDNVKKLKKNLINAIKASEPCPYQ